MKEGLPKHHQTKKTGLFGSISYIGLAAAAIGILTVSVWNPNGQSSPESNKLPAPASTLQLEPTRIPIRREVKDVIVDVKNKSNMRLPDSADVNFSANYFVMEVTGVTISLPLSDSRQSMIFASKGESNSSSRVEFRVDSQLDKESGKVNRWILANLPFVSENTCKTVTVGKDEFVNGGTDRRLVLSPAESTQKTDYKMVVNKGKVSIFVNGIFYSEKIFQVAARSCIDKKDWIFVQSEGPGLQNSTVEQVRISIYAEAKAWK